MVSKLLNNMNEISKSELKVKMFELLRKVQTTQEPLTITEFGTPVLVISPVKTKKKFRDVFAPYRNKIKNDPKVFDETSEEEWEALNE